MPVIICNGNDVRRKFEYIISVEKNGESTCSYPISYHQKLTPDNISTDDELFSFLNKSFDVIAPRAKSTAVVLPEKQTDMPLVRKIRNVVLMRSDLDNIRVYLLIPDEVRYNMLTTNPAVRDCKRFVEKELKNDSQLQEKIADTVSVLLGSYLANSTPSTFAKGRSYQKKNVKISNRIPEGVSKELSDYVKANEDETFSEMLERKIKEKGLKASQCYNRANITRQLYSKIKNDLYYRPKKQTVLAFAVALRMDINETNEFLMHAGYVLSHSNVFDMVVEYHIREEIYDIHEINEVLFTFDQPLLGF